MTPDEYREKMLLPYTFASNIEAKKEMAQIGFRGDCVSFKHENKQLDMTVKRKNMEEKVYVPFISFSDYPTDSQQYRQMYDFYNTAYAVSADAFATDKKNDFAYIKLAACYEQFDKFFFENYDNIVKYKNLIVDLSDNRGGGGQYTYNVLSALVDRDTIRSTRSTTKINNSAKKAKASSRIYYWNDSTVSREEKDMFYPFFYNNAFEAIDWLPEYYVNEIPDSLRYKGNIYLIVNGCTVSAAESFVAMLAQNPKVKILGRQTNGALGQPLVNELPSGMKFYIDTYKTLDTKGIDISKGIKPDYYCDFTWLDGHEGLGGEALVLPVGAQGRLLPGGVAVEGEDDLPAAHAVPGEDAGGGVGGVPEQAAHDARVVGAEGRAAGGHGRGHPGQVGGHDVGVALDHDDAVPGGDVPLGQVEAVEDLALVVDGGLGGVEVLGDGGVLVGQAPAAEADGGPGHVADGPHDAVPEAVVDAPPAGALAAQARGDQLVLGEALGPQDVGEVVPAGGGEADAEALQGVVVEPPRVQEAARPGGQRVGARQLGAEPVLGDAVGLQQAPAGAGLDAVAHGAVGLLVAQPHAGPPGQVLHGLGEGQVVDPLHEGDDVAALAAPEAVPQAQLGADVEGGGALVVEGAQALHGARTPALEGHVLADDVLDPDALADGVDVLALDESRHGAILGGPVPQTWESSPQSLACQVRAEVSVREAIWSTTARRRPASSSARRQASAKIGSRWRSPEPTRASARSNSSVRWRR